MSPAARLAPLLILAACGGSPDSVVWDCQLKAQQGNAGKSADAAAERSRDVESCMRGRGYRLDVGNPACRNGATRAACYRAM